MISKSSDRKSDLRNASVLEVIIAVILILIIFIFFQGETISGYEKLDVEIGKLKRQLAEKDAELVRLGSEVARLKEQLEFYKDLTQCATPEECERIKIGDEQAEQIAELKVANANLQNKIDQLNDLLKEKGDGIVKVPGSPPCQLDALNPKIRFHGLIGISASGWRFEPKLSFEYPGTSDQRLRELSNSLLEQPGLNDLIQTSRTQYLTSDEFQKFGNMAYRQSEKLGCRYYVRYIDNDFVQKEQLRIMERFFYITKQ